MHPIMRRIVASGLACALPFAAVVALLLALPPSAQASNVVVTNCTAAGLAAKLAITVDNDVVTFACAIGGPTIVVTQTQVIQHDITINGGSVITLSGGSAVGVLAVPAGRTVTINYLTVAHGRADHGGALVVSGTAVADTVTFINNKTSGAVGDSGGAAYVASGGQLIVRNSKFLTNTAPPVSDGGGAIGSSGVLTAVNDLFSGNVGNGGGAILLSNGTGYVASSNFINNGALFGGAIMANANVGLLADEFDHNHTRGTLIETSRPQIISQPLGGGAIFVLTSANVAILQNYFFSNTAANDTLIGLGGAIANLGNLGVADSRFNQNAAQGDGGTIFNSGQAAIGGSDLSNGYSFLSGGAISNTGTLNVSTSVFGGNIAADNGGALDNFGHASLIFDLIAENDAAAGGAIRNQTGGFLFVGASRLSGNAAVSNAGGAILNNATLTVTNSTLDNNHSNTNGAALFNGGAGATTQVLNSTLISNTTVASAGALRRTGGSLTLINTIVSGNQPNNCSGTVVDGGHNLQFSDSTCGLSLTNNPQLGPSQDNGGPNVGTIYGVIPTYAPRSNSPAINGGDDASCPARDERGYQRNSPCDIGAIEQAFLTLLPVLQK